MIHVGAAWKIRVILVNGAGRRAASEDAVLRGVVDRQPQMHAEQPCSEFSLCSIWALRQVFSRADRAGR